MGKTSTSNLNIAQDYRAGFGPASIRKRSSASRQAVRNFRTANWLPRRNVTGQTLLRAVRNFRTGMRVYARDARAFQGAWIWFLASRRGALYRSIVRVLARWMTNLPSKRRTRGGMEKYTNFIASRAAGGPYQCWTINTFQSTSGGSVG